MVMFQKWFASNARVLLLAGPASNSQFKHNVCLELRSCVLSITGLLCVGIGLRRLLLVFRCAINLIILSFYIIGRAFAAENSS